MTSFQFAFTEITLRKIFKYTGRHIDAGSNSADLFEFIALAKFSGLWRDKA